MAVKGLIEREKSPFCALVTNCVTDHLRWFYGSLGKVCEKKEGPDKDTR